MTWEVHLDPSLGLIHTIYRGTISKRDVDDATAQARALASGDGPHLFLTELLDAEPRLSTMDIYDTPGEWNATGFGRGNRLALVVPNGGKAWDDARFYETRARNRGWLVAVFSQRDEAIEWLTARPGP